MKLSAGYKETEIGLVPDGWDVVQLSDLLDFRNGVNADKRAYGRGVPFINVLEVLTRSHLRASDIPGRVALDRRVVEAFVVRFGDVLFNRTSETQEDVALAAVYCDSEPVVFGGFVIRGRPKDARLDPVFAGYGLRSKAIRTQLAAMGQGAIRANVGQGDLGKVFVPLPPLPEQRLIATTLSEISSLLAALEQLIVKKRVLKQAAMQDLLTGKRRLSGFDGAFVRYSFGDVLRVRHGKSQRGIAHLNGRFAILATGGVIGHTNVFLHEGPSVLIGRKGTIDSPRFVDEPFWTVDTLFFTEISKRTSPKYVYYAFCMIDWQSYNEASGVPSLNATTIESIQFSFPPLEEQVAIAAVLTDMDAEIEALVMRLEKTRLLKQGVMEELLTGRIRLT